MSKPIDPLVFAGAIIAAVSLMTLVTEWTLRLFRSRGLVQGAVGRKRGESFHDQQRRNRGYDDREISVLGRRRFLVIAAAAVGVVMVGLGLAL